MRACGKLLGVTAMHSLLEAFDLRPGRVLSLAGGGGKTSLMYALARAVLGCGQRALTTTTTRIFPPGPGDSPALLVLEEHPDGRRAIALLLAEYGHVTVAQRRTPDGKLAGIPCALVDELAASGLAEVIIVEADGSAGRPLKAARDGEPVFAPSSTDCVLVMGADALGSPLEETHVFRSALASEITGLAPGAPVTLEAAVALLIGPRGLGRGAPPASRLVVFLNKVEGPAQEPDVHALASMLLAQSESPLCRVVMGSLRQAEQGFTVFERP